MVEGFFLVLRDYGMSEIREAMFDYIKGHSDIPAPADIVKLIERDKQYDGVKIPELADVIRYEKLGIPLSASQQKMLDEHRGAA